MATPRIQQAIARIAVERADGTTDHGTGTLVASRTVLTALHVVVDAVSGEPGWRAVPSIVCQFRSRNVEATIEAVHVGRDDDWALLRCAEDVEAEPVGLQSLDLSGGEWESFGYPRFSPMDPITVTGRVTNHEAEERGIPTIQLQCEQAGAGLGAPVGGLSGAPCLIRAEDGELVVAGVVRSAHLDRAGRSVGGILLATPIRRVLDACSDLRELRDPCAALPPIASPTWPERPYRYLRPLGPEDGVLLQGRCRETRRLIRVVSAPERERLILLFGPSGCGKSSLLGAGLRARFRHGTVVSERYRCGEPLIDQWRRLVATARASGDEPRVVVLDQMEEAYIGRSPSISRRDVRDLFHEFHRDCREGTFRNVDKLVVSFRKEWLPEIERELEAANVRALRVSLEPLDRRAIREVIHAPEVAGHYRIRVEPELETALIDAVEREVDYAVAAPLQVMLSRLWDATSSDRAHGKDSHFTAAALRAESKRGPFVAVFLKDALSELAKSQPAAVATGLALDVLFEHTTGRETARTLTASDRKRLYSSSPHVDQVLIPALESAGLCSRDGADGTRLIHDVLAAAVRSEFAQSPAPGQSARRAIEEALRSDWLMEDRVGWVEHGLGGMRDLTEPERALFAAAKERRRVSSRNLAAGATFVVGFVLLLLWSVASKVAREQRLTQSVTLANESNRIRPIDRIGALEKSVSACESMDTTAAKMALHQSLWATRGMVRFASPATPLPEGRYSAADLARGRLARWEPGDGAVHVRDLTTGSDVVSPIVTGSVTSLALSTDGSSVIVGHRGFIERRGLWEAQPIKRWSLHERDALTLAISDQMTGGARVALVEDGARWLYSDGSSEPVEVQQPTSWTAVAACSNSAAVGHTSGDLTIITLGGDPRKHVRTYKLETPGAPGALDTGLVNLPEILGLTNRSVVALAMSRDGGSLASVTRGGVLQVWDLTRRSEVWRGSWGEVLSPRALEENIRVCLDKDTRQVFAASGAQIRQWFYSPSRSERYWAASTSAIELCGPAHSIVTLGNSELGALTSVHQDGARASWDPREDGHGLKLGSAVLPYDSRIPYVASEDGKQRAFVTPGGLPIEAGSPIDASAFRRRDATFAVAAGARIGVHRHEWAWFAAPGESERLVFAGKRLFGVANGRRVWWTDEGLSRVEGQLDQPDVWGFDVDDTSKRIAVRSKDKIFVFDLDSSRSPRMEVAAGAQFALARGGARLVVEYRDDSASSKSTSRYDTLSLSLFDIPAGTVQSLPSAERREAAISADGSIVAIPVLGGVDFIDLATCCEPSKYRTLAHQDVPQVYLSASASYALLWFEGRELQLVARGGSAPRISAHLPALRQSRVYLGAVTFSPGERRVAVVEHHGPLEAWLTVLDTSAGAPSEPAIPIDPHVTHVDWLDDNTLVYLHHDTWYRLDLNLQSWLQTARRRLGKTP